MTTLTARLVRRADLAVVADLTLSRERHWQEQLNEPGSGSLVLQADDPAHDLVDDGHLVQFLLDGAVAFTYVVRARDHVAIDPNEAAGQQSTLSGPGVLALLDEAVVYPSPGTDSVPVQDVRLFSWPAYDYNDATWTTATELVTLGGTRGPDMPTGPLDGTASASYWHDTNIEEWPDPTAWFVWSLTGPGGAPITNPLEWSPAGDVYFRKVFTVPAGAMGLRYHVLFDAEGELFLDGVSIAAGEYGDEPNINLFSKVIDISPGTHAFAALLHNDPDPEADESHNPGGFALTAYAVDAAGGIIGAGPIVHTDATWRMLPYPATPPGMTPGEALRMVVNEAQTRGALGGLVMTFTDTQDTAGAAWPVVGDISTPVGTDVLTFARELAVTYIDIAMDSATLALNAWVQDGQGTDTAVEFHPAPPNGSPMAGNVATLTHRRAL